MAAGGAGRLWIVNGLVVLLVLLAVGGTVYGLTRTSSSEDTSLRTTPLGRGTVAETVTASGTVTSATSATLNFSTSGRIADVRVRLGDRVTKGQTVAVLDGEYARANLDAADAQVSAAEQTLDDARYAKDHPQTTAAPAAGTGTTAGAAGAAQQPAAAAPAPAAPAAPAAPPTTSRPTAAPATTQPQSRRRSGNFAGSSHGVEAVGPVAAQTPTPSPGGSGAGSTGTGSASGTGQSGAAAQTSEDPGEAAVRNAESSLATARANRIQAFQSTENLDLVAPQDGTVVTLDGVTGQLAGPQGIVVSSTATGNPAGGRLPDGSAISSGAGSGQSASSGAASGAAAAGAAAAGGATGGASVTAAPTAPAVMTVADLASMQVLAQIPELDVGRVTGGQAVDVSVNALAGDRIPGTVATVNLLPGSGSTVQYGTAVALGGPAGPPPLGLRPGMSASVAITVRQANDVTFLPSVAVTPVGGPNSGAATVNVLAADGTTQSRQIGVGLSSDTVTQVTSGLSMGELVVLPDPNTPNVFGQGGPPPQTQGGQRSGR